VVATHHLGVGMRGRAWKRAFGSALAAATVALMTACGSSDDTHAAQAAPTQPPANQTTSTTTASSSQEFVSNRYDFGLTLPQGWSAVDAKVDWSGTTLSSPGAPSFMNASDAGRTRTLMAAAATVPAGMQLADFRAAMVSGAGRNCTPGESRPPDAGGPSVETTTLGGEPALEWKGQCTDADVNKIVALHDGRGYVIYMPSATANDDAEDQRIFEAIRQSFHFTS